ncbi:MAG: hypothetical protein H7329_19570 [Opitutaceae bacterium]|nr:hypothetical protein [Cytophagales bacterium]
MPYYRIIIWTKRRKLPFQGIRLIGNPNINAVHQEYSQQAHAKYRENLIDVEVQMLSKLSTAVKLFERKEMSKKD